MGEPMDLFTEVQKISEAYCVQRGIPINRRFTDADLVDAHASLENVRSVLANPRFTITTSDGASVATLTELLTDNRDDEPLCEWLVGARVGDAWRTGGATGFSEVRRVA
jgi:hypothetical protein